MTTPTGAYSRHASVPPRKMASQRAADVTPFMTMDVLERANERDDLIHLEVGEPDFSPPDRVVETAVAPLRAGNTDYTAARGKPALRRAIADRYDRVYGVGVAPDRVVVTPGTSPGLLLSMAALVDPGDEVILTDPHYACYPNFVRMVGGEATTVPLRPVAGFVPQVADFEAAEYLRVSYATDADAIQTAIERIDRLLTTVERG